MGILRPATPGFLVTTLATVLLLVVSFSVPWFKSVYFLKAQVTQDNQSGFITFGVLGYCTTVDGGSTSCTPAKLGYQFNPNQLVGDNIKFLQIPSVVVKWITWALALHIIAFGLAAIAAIFGLLAHIREFSMTCFSSCISGIAAGIAFIAFIFDLVLFFTVKARINDVKGGSAVIGNAVWLTLASWLLLFFSGCFYTIGRCCLSRRPRGPDNDRWRSPSESGPNAKPTDYAEMMRLDAVKAEADRKARQAAGERGLPAFPTLEESKPLSSNYEATYLEDEEPASPYRDNLAGAGRVAGPRSPRKQPTDTGRELSQTAAAATGYTPGQPGSRTIDQYNNAQSYPSQPPSRVSQRQPSTSPGPQYDAGQYQSNNYNNLQQSSSYGAAPQTHFTDPYAANNNSNPYGSIAAAAGVTGAAAYAAQKRYSTDQHFDNNNYYNQPAQLPVPGTYGHGQEQTSYHSAYSHPQDFSQAQDNYANPVAYATMPNPHDEGLAPNPQAYGSAYPSSSTPGAQYYTQPAAAYTSYDPNVPDNGAGASYFQHGNSQIQNTYPHNPSGLHPVQEASGSISEYPPGYSQGAYSGVYGDRKS